MKLHDQKSHWLVIHLDANCDSIGTSLRKQKIVIKVSTDGQRFRPAKAMKIVIYLLKLMLPYDIIWKKSSISTAKITTKAMKIAVTSPGVASVALTGEEKNQLVVTGEGVDAVNLTKLIRQTVGLLSF